MLIRKSESLHRPCPSLPSLPDPDGYVYRWGRDRFWCVYLIVCVFSSLAQLHRRSKNRLQLDPEARCIGVDMNKYALLNPSLKILTNGRSHDRNWVGYLNRAPIVPVI